MNRIYWDSMLFIYLLEGNPIFGARVKALFESVVRRNDRLCTSVFTLGEVLTGPRRQNDAAAIKAIKAFFASDEVEVLALTADAADRYSVIRASMRVSQADAIHLATASANGVELFVTNDRDLQRVTVPGIRFMMDLDGRVY